MMPFLYPCLSASIRPTTIRALRPLARHVSTAFAPSDEPSAPISHLDPPPDSFSQSVFTDKCQLTLYAGAGGHGCISFVREKYISAGPANGGDGGTGGNIYIQAVAGETSLHKLARRSILKAGRGRNGLGKSKGGQRGEDVLVQVPVGTVVRELWRYDPLVEEEQQRRDTWGKLKEVANDGRPHEGRDKWLLYPASMPEEFANMEFPPLPRARRTNLAAAQPKAPIMMDLNVPMEQPLLLAAGAVGGLGNPHFVTKTLGRPKFCTKGERGMQLKLELELKLLADLGFVGLPNAGKSTLLRALSNSRARVGSWAFTTLQPNIGTVVLDDHRGRAKITAFDKDGKRRAQFSIADIPGLVPDAHRDRGLGLDFLRHIERARVLAFVVDLGAGNAVQTLKTLWRELEMYERMKEDEMQGRTETRIIDWQTFGTTVSPAEAEEEREETVLYRAGVALPPARPALPPVSTKPWFVVASKADLEGTQDNFAGLQDYLKGVEAGTEEHPAGKGRRNRWKGQLAAMPISAIRGHGVEQIAEWTVSLLGK